jgi:hypothetical protein
MLYERKFSKEFVDSIFNKASRRMPLDAPPSKITEFSEYELNSIFRKIDTNQNLLPGELTTLNAYLQLTHKYKDQVVPLDSLAVIGFRTEGKSVTEPSVYYSHFNHYDKVIPVVKSPDGRYFDTIQLKEIHTLLGLVTPKGMETLKELGYNLDGYVSSFIDDVKITDNEEKRSFNERAYTLDGHHATLSTEEFPHDISTLEKKYISLYDYTTLVRFIENEAVKKFTLENHGDKLREAKNFINNLGRDGM